MNCRTRRALLTLATAGLLVTCAARGADEHPLLAVMQDELALSMSRLVGVDGTRPYFIQFTLTDIQSVEVAATLGALTSDRDDHTREFDVEVRCGDYALDNTRQIRDAGWQSHDRWGGSVALPLDGEPLSTRQVIWLKTDETFKAAVERLRQVEANLKVKVAEEDPADDFAREPTVAEIRPWLTQPCDRAALVERVRRYAERFRAHPEIYGSRVTLSGQVTNKLMVNSEGSRLQFGQGGWRISVQASTIAADGMELSQYNAFDAHAPEGLPSDAEVLAAVDQVIAEILALRTAPLVEPYTGPAILMNRAAGVFFHEIFGHRVEGHRQKDVEEGQTFAKMVGQPVLPEFLQVYDDPTLRTFGDIELNGYYPYDDECVPAQRVAIVEDGILRNFLMSRAPTRGFTRSNGHGRRQPGMRAVSRMGNLILTSNRHVPYEELRHRLIEECRRQGKDFGLVFKDISGGFTTTRRWSPQAFKVIPIIVYRVYVDGRPDELVRGVDIVGTPLTAFSKVLATADDPGVFNGVCGAESGGVPVSAIAPSVLVQQIEIEKKRKAQDRPPILTAPIAEEQ